MRPGEERLTSVPSEPVKLIVAFGAKNPDDGVRVSIGRGHYRSTSATYCCTPGCRDGRRQAGPDFQGEQSPRLSWTVCAFGLKCDENAVRRGIGRWGGDDGPLGHSLDDELGAGAAQVVAVEKVGFAVVA